MIFNANFSWILFIRGSWGSTTYCTLHIGWYLCFDSPAFLFACYCSYLFCRDAQVRAGVGGHSSWCSRGSNDYTNTCFAHWVEGCIRRKRESLHWSGMNANVEDSIEVPVPDHENERSCIYVLRVAIMNKNNYYILQ